MELSPKMFKGSNTNSQWLFISLTNGHLPSEDTGIKIVEPVDSLIRIYVTVCVCVCVCVCTHVCVYT